MHERGTGLPEKQKKGKEEREAAEDGGLDAWTPLTPLECWQCWHGGGLRGPAVEAGGGGGRSEGAVA